MARRLAVLLVLLFVQACAVQVPTDPEARVEVFVLGIAQDGAVPHLGCNKPCCEKARSSGLRLHPACIAVHDKQTGKLVLVEATPQVEEQLALLHQKTGMRARGRHPVDAILITHAHIGHYLGLAHFGREVASTDRIPLHVSPRMTAFLSGHGPWRQLVKLNQITLRPLVPRKRFEILPGVEVTAIPVPHRDEFSDTMAFKIHGPKRTVLFVPDVDAWHKQKGLLEELLRDVDVAYLDGSFYDGSELPGRSMAEIPHPPMVDTMKRLEARARNKPGSLRFIHLNHTNPALFDRKIRREIERRGFRIAEQGERIGI